MLLSIVLTSILIHEFVVYGNNVMGPYNPVLESVSECDGPKPTTVSTVSISKNQKQGKTFVHTEITLSEDVDDVKYEVNLQRAGRNGHRNLPRIFLEDICKNKTLVDDVFKTIFPMNPGQNCKINMGSKTSDLGLRRLIDSWIGDNAVYGSYKGKATFTTDDKNVLCLDIAFNLIKK